MQGKKIPVHGDGSYIRDWTYVEDNISGIMTIIEKGIKGLKGLLLLLLLLIYYIL